MNNSDNISHWYRKPVVVALNVRAKTTSHTSGSGVYRSVAYTLILQNFVNMMDCWITVEPRCVGVNLYAGIRHCVVCWFINIFRLRVTLSNRDEA